MDDTSHAGSPLRALLVYRRYWRWSAAAQMARLSPLMAALAFVLAGAYATGRYAVGGLMVTAYEVAGVCCAPFAGSLLDRLGPVIGVPRLLGLSTLALAALAAAVALRAPASLLVSLAALAGALPAGVGGALRSLLSDAVPPRLLAPALAIDATVVEVVVVAAPLFVSAAAIAAPPGAIVAMAAAAAAAALLVRGLRGAPSAPAVSGDGGAPSSSDRRTVWSNRRFVFWLIVSLAFGHAAGTAEIGALPLATRLGGGTGAAAGLVAVLAATSALSGVAYAALAHRLAAGAVARACVLLALLVLGCLALGLATGWAPPPPR